MAGVFIQQIGIFTIPSGSSISNVISQSAYGKYDDIIIQPSGSFSGTASLQGVNNIDNPSACLSASYPWTNMRMPTSTTDISVSPTAGLVLESFPVDAMRLSTTLALSSSAVFNVAGQIEVALTGLAAAQ